MKDLLSNNITHEPPTCFTAHALTACEDPIDMSVPALKYFPIIANAFPMEVKELSSCMQSAFCLY